RSLRMRYPVTRRGTAPRNNRCCIPVLSMELRPVAARAPRARRSLTTLDPSVKLARTCSREVRMAKTRLTIFLLTTVLALCPVSWIVGGVSTTANDDNGPVPKVSDPTLARILDQWDRKQQESVTLVASFTERKDLKLLAKPVISHGEFYYSRPNHVRWEYKEPDHKVYVITED